MQFSHGQDIANFTFFVGTYKFWLSPFNDNIAQKLLHVHVPSLVTSNRIGIACQCQGIKKGKTGMHLSSLRQIWDEKAVSYNLKQKIAVQGSR
jgi:hypothetical protein